jgi:hypothetical protein
VKYRFLSFFGSVALVLGAITLTVPARSQNISVEVKRWLEITRLRGNVLFLSPQQRPAQIGDRLQTPGQGAITSPRSYAILLLDTQIGRIHVAENSDLRVKSLTITPLDGRVTLLEVLKGQARLLVRRFTNPDSRLELETPAGVIGVRGTEFGVGVGPNGKTNVATLAGTVTASAQGQTVQVEKGFASSIVPGEPPTPPRLLTNDLRLKVIRLARNSLGTLEFKAQVDPFNLVWVNDQPVDVNKEGYIKAILPLPTSFLVRVRVQSPLGQDIAYTLLVR